MSTVPARNWQPFFRRVGTYAAASWVALQATYTISDIWDLSDWFVQVLFIVLAAGLLITAWRAWILMNRGASNASTHAPRARQKALVVVALAVFGVALLYLWPDARLDPAVQHLLSREEHPYDDSKNAAYLLYGIEAPAGQEPISYGRFVVDTYEATGTELPNPAPLRSTLDDSNRVSLSNGGDVDALFAEIDSVPAVLAANSDLLQRYRMLRQLPFYTAPVRLTDSSPAPPLRNFSDMAFLARREIIFEANRGNAQQAWNLWEQEVAMHRSLFANTDYMLTKMIFLNTFADLVRLRPLLIARGLLPEGAPVARLSLPELSLLVPLTEELLSNINAMLAMDEQRWGVGFAKPSENFLFTVLPLRMNATINQMMTSRPVLQSALLSAADVYARVQSLQPLEIPAPEYLVNGAGIMLIRRFEGDNWYRFLIRLHDMDRLILLSQIGERMLAEGVRAEFANGWLSALTPEYSDPFTGDRALWEDGTLHFPLELESSFTKKGLDLPLP